MACRISRKQRLNALRDKMLNEHWTMPRIIKWYKEEYNKEQSVCYRDVREVYAEVSMVDKVKNDKDLVEKKQELEQYLYQILDYMMAGKRSGAERVVRALAELWGIELSDMGTLRNVVMKIQPNEKDND